MKNTTNLKIYRRYAPIYDSLMRFWTAAPRRKAVELLKLKTGEQLLVPGVGQVLICPIFLPVSASRPWISARRCFSKHAINARNWLDST